MIHCRVTMCDIPFHLDCHAFQWSWTQQCLSQFLNNGVDPCWLSAAFSCHGLCLLNRPLCVNITITSIINLLELFHVYWHDLVQRIALNLLNSQKLGLPISIKLFDGSTAGLPIGLIMSDRNGGQKLGTQGHYICHGFDPLAITRVFSFQPRVTQESFISENVLTVQWPTQYLDAPKPSACKAVAVQPSVLILRPEKISTSPVRWVSVGP